MAAFALQLDGQPPGAVACPLHPGRGVRIALAYLAGRHRALPVERVRRALERHGHQLICEVGRDADFRRMPAVDLVVVAGGDGSVATVARSLAGISMPMAILPLGTANNIAKCLGMRGSIDSVIAGWDLERRVGYDFGVARGPWGERTFLEGMGCGLVPAVMDLCREALDLEAALRAYAGVLSRLASQPLGLTLDGERIEGSFLLLEVLNVGWVGPNLALAPESSPCDGWLEVAIAQEAERDAVARYLTRRLRREGGNIALPVRRVRELEIEGAPAVHIDDEIRPGGSITIAVKRSAFEILV